MKKMIIVCMAVLCLVCGCGKKADEGKRPNLNEIEICREKYNSDIDLVKKNVYRNLDFGECVFDDFPNCKSIHILEVKKDDKVSVDESIGIIEQWLDSIGENEIDLEIQLRDASGDLKNDESKEYPFCYPGVWENKDKLINGRGFFVNVQSCYIQMGDWGIYSMSDGTISGAVGGKAAMDALGVNSENIVSNGTVEGMRDEVYELLDGKLSIGEAAEIVQEYFNKGTPYINSVISYETPSVKVFSINDKYGYEFNLQRIYENVPMAYSEFGHKRFFDEDYQVMEDTIMAYVADNHVCAFTKGAQEFTSVKEETKMIALSDAVDYLENKMAQNMALKVNKVALVYCPIEFSQGKTIAYPMWELDGVNNNNNANMRIFMNVLNGEIYLYEY